MKILIPTLLLLISTSSLFAQEFNPEQRLTELIGKKENIGFAAAFSVNGEMKWSKSSGLSCEDSEIP